MEHKLHEVTLDLFGQEFSVSTTNIHNITGRELPTTVYKYGKTKYEFCISVFAKSRYDAIKQVKAVIETSNWIKYQNLKSLRLL